MCYGIIGGSNTDPTLDTGRGGGDQVGEEQQIVSLSAVSMVPFNSTSYSLILEYIIDCNKTD